MTTTRLRAAAALTFAFVAASCGGDGGGGPSFPDSVSTADAQDFADGVASYATYVGDAMNFGGPSINLAAPSMLTKAMASVKPAATTLDGVVLRRPQLVSLDWRDHAGMARGLRASAGTEGCTITAYGFADPDLNTPVDLNGNGIPDDLYLKYVCQVTDSVAGDTVVVQLQTIELSVVENTASLYGETLSETIRMDAHNNHGQYQFGHIDVSGKTDIRSGSIADQANLTYRVETNLSGTAEFEEFGESWNNSFDPTGTITLGNDLPNGALTISGRRYGANSDDQNLSFTTSTTTALAYDAACALANTNPPFTAGVLLGKLNNNSSQASFEITFTSCANYTVAVTGAYDGI